MTRRPPVPSGRVASFEQYQLNPQPEKARDHYYHDYDADDVEDVHCHAPGELVVTVVWDNTTMLGAPKSSAFTLRTDDAPHFHRGACLVHLVLLPLSLFKIAHMAECILHQLLRPSFELSSLTHFRSLLRISIVRSKSLCGAEPKRLLSPCRHEGVGDHDSIAAHLSLHSTCALVAGSGRPNGIAATKRTP